MESKSSQVPNVSRICCASKIRYTFIQSNDHSEILSIKKESLQIFQHKSLLVVEFDKYCK